MTGIGGTRDDGAQVTRDTITKAAVLAVDGGNSKTDLALVAADGTLIAAVRGPGSSHQRLGLQGAMRALREGVAMLRAHAAAGAAGGPKNPEAPCGPHIGPPDPPGPAPDSGVPLARVGVFCLAGIDLPVDDRRVGAALRAEGLTDSFVLDNDAFSVLWAGCPEKWGVAVGAGTGLNCVGVAPDGRRLRFPALGRISGDWVAGGRWLGVRALGQAVRAADGRGRGTVLEQTVPAYYGLPTPMAVAEAVYTSRIEERQLFALAPTVFRAAADGDAVARELLDQIVDEIVTYVATAVRRLRLDDVEVPVVLGGGLFNSGDPGFLGGVREGVASVAPRALIRVLTSPPVLGAALWGLATLEEAEPGAEARVAAAFAAARPAAGAATAGRTAPLNGTAVEEGQA
ncbi:N-acetylglucosamine kinase [Streptomyces sp. NPDC004609]|uniref:N-acetylglucosamine kinase n=1 Tax=Streptomyces sp. NPDC004609 TaxID=3364704 RepID=UPI0036BCAF6D